MPTKTVTVTTGGELLLGLDKKRRTLILFNNGSAVVRVGPDDSDIGTEGMPLQPLSGISFARVDGDEVFEPKRGVAASGSQTLVVVEQFGEDLIDAMEELKGAIRP